MKRLYILLFALMAIASSAKAWESFGHEFVDLGLPSGTLWATCNIGANSPEEFGWYFAWGETDPKVNYDWSTYKWSSDGTSKHLTKYTESDGWTGLFTEDDAAAMNWGTLFQTPWIVHYRELTNDKYTKKEWTTLNGVDGWKITSKINLKSIFLPAAGYKDGERLRGVGLKGIYHLGNHVQGQGVADSVSAGFEINPSKICEWWYINRSAGQSVRAILEHTPAQPYAVFANGTMKFYCDDQWQSRNDGEVLEVHRKLEVTTGWYGLAPEVTRVEFDPSFANFTGCTSTKAWFESMKNLESITGLEYLNTSNVTDMSLMFSGCEALTELDVSNFNTENVTDFSDMFYNCKALTSLDLSNFNTANATNFTEMFRGCSALTSLDLSNFNTANAVSMPEMFMGCSSLTKLDLSSFNICSARLMQAMFRNCSSLETIIVSPQWDAKYVTYSQDMFLGCTNIKGGQGTIYNESIVTSFYARIDGGSAKPGYLTCKPFEVDGIWYCVTGDNTVEVTRKEENDISYHGNVNIPSTITYGGKTYNVTAIGKYAFNNCVDVTSVTIPASVNTLGYLAFGSCPLQQIICYAVTPPKFNGLPFTTECYGATLYVPHGSVENYADANYWKNFANVLKIGGAYFERDGIYYIATGNNEAMVTYKDTNYNTYSGNVVIPATVSYDGATYSVTAIGNRAFKDCSGLTGVTIGSNVLAIGDEAFRNCGEWLTKVVIPDQVTTIGYAAFMECQRLWEVHLGRGVTYIDNAAFALNDALQLVICTALTPPVTDDSFTDYDYPWVYVPSEAYQAYKNSVYDWHLFAKLSTRFNYDFAKDDIFYKIQPDSSSVYVVRKYDRLNDESYPYTEDSYDIPDSVSFEGSTYTVTGIGAFAFKECTNLKRISLPSTLQVIWNGAFAGDENIEAIYCYATTPPTISYDETLALVDPFEGYTTDVAKLIIHGSAFDAYKTNQGWYYFCELRNVDGYDFEKDGIYYKIQPDGTSVYVTNAYNPETDTYDFNYSGGEDYIPETVTFDGTTYTVTGIAAQAFWNDTHLNSIALPKTIQAIEACTFNCSYLESIVCHAMTPPVLSAFAFGFEEEAFNGCIFVPGFAYGSYEDADVWQDYNRDVLPYQFEVDGLYYYSANEGEVSLTVKDDFYYSGNYVGAINIPETVTYQGTTYTVVDIEGTTFKGSSNLTEVTIPATVTLIGNKVFQDCTSLAIVNCNATTPPELRFNSFDESHYQDVTLNVPEGTKSLYQAADYWKNFLNIVAPVDPYAPIDYAGTIWQEYTSADGELSESSDTDKTVTIAPSTETPGIVNLGYPAFTMAGTNQRLRGFNIDGVSKYELEDGTIYYALTEPTRVQIRSVSSTLLCNATLYGVQSSLDSTPALKLILTGVRTQFEDVVWFGNGTDLDEIKAALENVEDIITGVPSMEDGRWKMEDGSIYNLAGQRLNKMQKGINIVGGRKVLVK